MYHLYYVIHVENYICVGGQPGRGRSRGTASEVSSRGRGRNSQNPQQQFPVTSKTTDYNRLNRLNIDQQKVPDLEGSGCNTSTRMHGMQSQQQVCVYDVLDDGI